MPSYSIGEALSLLIERSKWKPKMQELRLRNEWEEIAGKIVARYTRNLSLHEGKLTIFTDVAALKQELLYGKAPLIATINKHFGETVVTDIMVR
jgi:predicted nucleic acid-binding Zn ribbon protein